MSLKTEIEVFQKEFLPQIPKDALNLLGATAERLAKSGIANKCLKKGEQAPSFSLPNIKAEMVSSSELLQQGPLVVTFYRGGWCPYCNLELKAYQLAWPEIKNLGARLVAISPEVPDKSIQTQENNSLSFEVLNDVGNTVSRAFGLVFNLAEELRPIYQDFGIDIPAHNGDDKFELPIPATYVIDPSGTIVHAFVDTDYTKRMEPAEVVEILKTS